MCGPEGMQWGVVFYSVTEKNLHPMCMVLVGCTTFRRYAARLCMYSKCARKFSEYVQIMTDERNIYAAECIGENP